MGITFGVIAQLCKETKQAIVFETREGQWIGNGSVFLNMQNLPRVTEENVLNALGVSEGKKDEWYVDFQHDTNRMFRQEMNEDIEVLEGNDGLCVILNGKMMTPLYTDQWLCWFGTKIIGIATKGNDTYRDYKIREIGNRRALVIRDGLIVTSIILEMTPGENLVEAIETLAHEITKEKFGKKE